MKKTLTIIGLFILLQLIIADTPEVLACSGGGRQFQTSDLSTVDLLVRATVIDTDDPGYNAVLRVEDYYKGEGDRLLTVMNYSHGFLSGKLVRGYDTGCQTSGSWPYYRKGSQAYFLLNEAGNGVYTDLYRITGNLVAIDGMMFLEQDWANPNGNDTLMSLDLSETDFIDLMLEAGERDAPIPPSEGVYNHYPLMRFLNITTENGTRYQVNPDRSVSEMPEDGPLAISPDGAHVAFRMDDERIGFQYIWTDNRIETDESQISEGQFGGRIVNGLAIQFSNDSNFAAVWDDEHITIYMLTNYEDSYYGQHLELITIAEIDVVTNPENPLPTVLWSADSTTVVWHDGEGFWHWNLFDAAESQQLLTNAQVDAEMESNAVLIDVSLHGRYVRIGDLDDWYLVDTQTGDMLRNAIVSPDERFLIQLGLDEEPDVEPECVPPLRENCATKLRAIPEDIFFFDVNWYGIVACSNVEDYCGVFGESWNPAIIPINENAERRFLGSGIVGFRQLAYDVQNDQVAILVGDYELYFDFYNSGYLDSEDWQPYLDVLDLADTLDSPIASIEWGQPVFYDTYFLANPEDIP